MFSRLAFCLQPLNLEISKYKIMVEFLHFVSVLLLFDLFRMCKIKHIIIDHSFLQVKLCNCISLNCCDFRKFSLSGIY